MEPLRAALSGRHPLVAVVTAPPARAGRGRASLPNFVADEARARGLPVLQPESARAPEFLDALEALRPDLAVVVSYGQILTRRFLDAPRLGCINLHGSLLPRWRGASPVQAAILAGDAHTGVCIQRVVEELDAGAVLAERSTVLGATEDAPALFARLATLGAELLLEFLNGLEPALDVLPAGREQDNALVTQCRKVRKEHGILDWNAPAPQVARQVRAYAGWPVASTRLPDGAVLRILSGSAGEFPAPHATPGTVLAADEELWIACATGAYRPEVVQREGRARLTTREFLRGTHLEPGARLGGYPDPLA